MLDEPTFDSLAQVAFRELLAALDRADPDRVEADSTGEMLTIRCASGEKVVVNTQRAVRQIWVSGLGEGLRFGFDSVSGRWRDDRRQALDLYQFVRRCVREASGVELAL